MRQGRELAVVDSFVELADTLASDYDVGDFLHMLVEHCSEILDVDVAGVLLEQEPGTPRLAAATSEKMQRLEELEIRLDEGPCITAYRNVEQVVEEDLASARERWPQVVPHALEMGLHAVYAFPLRLRDDCIGALNLYREEPGPFKEDDIRLAQAFADVAAIGVLQERAVTSAELRAEQLQGALDSRIVIEQAKGIIIANMGISPDEAFVLLRKHARDKRVKLQEVAAGVVSGQSLN